MKPFIALSMRIKGLLFGENMNEQFEITINRLSPTLKRITHRLNGHFSFFDDDDLFQEALIYLWLSFEKGILDDKTDSYILQGCYFHLKNYLRTTLDKARLISLYHLLDEDEANMEEILTKDDHSSLDRIDGDILMEEARLSGLTVREKEVLELCLDGFTMREIGKRLGISHVMVIKIKNKIKDKCQKLKFGHAS